MHSLRTFEAWADIDATVISESGVPHPEQLQRTRWVAGGYRCCPPDQTQMTRGDICARTLDR
jgi:hypothetical protein